LVQVQLVHKENQLIDEQEQQIVLKTMEYGLTRMEDNKITLHLEKNMLVENICLKQEDKK